MPINDRNLEAGTKLTAKYKGQEHTVLVLADEEGGLAFELDNGTIFKSLSAAGSAVMNGVACNGWRFWTVAGEQAGSADEAAQGPTRAATEPKAKKNGQRSVIVKIIRRVPNQHSVPPGSTKWFCSACMKSFIRGSALGEPEACPEGHAREQVDELALGHSVDEEAAAR